MKAILLDNITPLLEYVINQKLPDRISQRDLDKLDKYYNPWDLRALSSKFHFKVWDEDDGECVDDWILKIDKEINFKRPKRVKSQEEKNDSMLWNIKAMKLGDEKLNELWKSVDGRYCDKNYWGEHE